MATAIDIITEALTELSILRIGASPSPAQSTHALSRLNAMINSWTAQGVVIDPSIPIPDQFEPTFVANLAVWLAPSYGAQPSPILMQRAKDTWFALQASFIVAPQAKFDSAIRQLPSQRLFGGFVLSQNDFLSGGGPSPAPSVSGFCTLTAGSPTTVVSNASCLLTSTVTITPYSQNAQAEWEFMQPLVAVGPLTGEFTVTHQNNQIPDRIFEYLIVI